MSVQPTLSDLTRPLRTAWPLRALWAAFAVYLIYAATQLDFSWNRLMVGFGEAGRFLSRMWPPNFTRWDTLVEGMIESLQIAVLASAIGILISLPIGFLAARNMTPVWVNAPTRVVIALCRSFHPVIVAIVFVKAIGFGALAGVAALVVASIGFIAKLFAEAIEEISPKQVEAVRATGAPFASVVTMASCRRSPRVSSASASTRSIRTSATPRWSASWAQAVSAARCSQPSSASTTTSSRPS